MVPPTNSPNTNKTKDTISGCCGCLLIIGIAFFIGSCLFGGDDTDTTTSKNTQVVQEEKKTPPQETQNDEASKTEQKKEDLSSADKSAVPAVPVTAPASQPSAPKENNFSKHEDSAPKSTLHYVGNASSMKYHISGCRAERKIKSGNRVELSSSDAARNAGYVPCGICKPR